MQAEWSFFPFILRDGSENVTAIRKINSVFAKLTPFMASSPHVPCSNAHPNIHQSLACPSNSLFWVRVCKAREKRKRCCIFSRIFFSPVYRMSRAEVSYSVMERFKVPVSPLFPKGGNSICVLCSRPDVFVDYLAQCPRTQTHCFIGNENTGLEFFGKDPARLYRCTPEWLFPLECWSRLQGKPAFLCRPRR